MLNPPNTPLTLTTLSIYYWLQKSPNHFRLTSQKHVLLEQYIIAHFEESVLVMTCCTHWP